MNIHAAHWFPLQALRLLAEGLGAVFRVEQEVGAEAAVATEDADQASMRRLAAGDTLALKGLFDRWKLPLLNYFYRALGNRADAEDLALQVFERIYRAAGRYRPEARFSTWLFSVARRELLHELRRRRRKPVEAVPAEELDLGAAGVSEDEPGRVREAEEHLLSTLQELPERERSALLLTASGELSSIEVARTVGVSSNHLNVILHRARQKLRALLDRAMS